MASYSGEISVRNTTSASRGTGTASNIASPPLPSTSSSSTATKPIPLAQPDRHPTTKKILINQIPTDLRTPPTSQPPPPPEAPLIVTTLLHALTLTTLHFTATVLLHNQYAQSLLLRPLLFSTLPTFPIYFLLTCLSRSSTFLRFPHARRVVLFAACVALGVRLVGMTNQGGYLKVLEGAPGVGVLWVAAVGEMEGWEAVVGVGIVGIWTWWRGYSFY